MIYCKTIYISTKWCISEDRETTNRRFTDALQKLYGLRVFFKCNNLLCENIKAQRTNNVHEQIWRKKITSLAFILNWQLKIRKYISVLEMCPHKITAAITWALEILGLWVQTQSCLYMYLFAYHDQLFKGNDECFLL